MQIFMQPGATQGQVQSIINHLKIIGAGSVSVSRENGAEVIHTNDQEWATFQSIRLMQGIRRITKGTKPLEDANVMEVIRLDPPSDYKKRLPVSDEVKKTVLCSRQEIEAILTGKDLRFIIILGPCSIYDPIGGLEYAKKLAPLARKYRDRLLIVMRSYFEKPRTTVGWEGLIQDPNLDESLDMQLGLQKAREFLLRVLKVGLPTATEFTDPITPQYIADLVCWGAIGARSAEAPAYRRMASGLSMPVGFKNGTGGSIQLAVDGVVRAAAPSVFLGVDQEEGRASVVRTTGNASCHIVLRGSSRGPNYDEPSVKAAIQLLERAGAIPRLLIDCSHDNSGKDYTRQPLVFRDVLRQRTEGNMRIVGVMLESNLHEGKQTINGGPATLKYGVSITDACISLEETELLLREADKSLG